MRPEKKDSETKRVKLLTIMLSIIAIAAVGVTGTWATFSKTQTSTGNTFQAGSLDVVIDGTDSQGRPMRSLFFTMSNMQPGDTATAYVELANTGTLDMLERVYFDNLTQSPGTFANELQVVVTLNPSPYSPQERGTRYGNTNTVIYSGSLTGIVGTNSPMNNVDMAFNHGQPLQSGWLAVYKIAVTLPSSAGNTYQGATLSSTLVVNDTQFAGQNQSNIIW